MIKNKTTHSMYMRMWAYFLVLAAIIMATIWCFQTFFMKTYYSAMKSHQIKLCGEEIFNEYNPENGIDDDFSKKFDKICF